MTLSIYKAFHKKHETGFEPEAEALFYIGFKVSCDISCDTLKYAILNRNFCDEHMAWKIKRKMD